MRKITTTALLVAIFLLSGANVFSQKNEKVSRKNALYLIEDGNWEKAKQMYLEMLKDDPDDQQLNLYCGVAYLNSRINGELSLDYFNKVDPDKIPGVLMLKAEAFHYIANFDSAKVYYAKYGETDGVRMEEGLKKEVSIRIEQCNTGNRLTQNPTEGMFVENLGADVNTKFLDYAPVVYEDLKTLVFTSTNANLFNIRYMTFQEKGEEEIFYTNYDPVYKKWLPRAKADGVVLSKEILSDDNESAITYSKDLSRFYFYRTGDLWVSENLGTPTKFPINTTFFTDNQIVAIDISKDEKHIFITSDRGGKRGSLDLYEAIKGDNGEWSAFKFMNGINTEFDEEAPFLSEDGNKFYFSSKGYNSIGDYDIFVATRTDTGWTNVKNMGVPVNSPANDIHFRLTGGSEEFGYLSSDRVYGQGDFDVLRVWTCYDIKSTNMGGKFIALGGPIDSADLILRNIDSSIVAIVDPLANNNNYSFKVNTETDYILELDVKGYAKHFYNISIPKQCSEYDIFQTLSCKLTQDQDEFVSEQKSTLTNAFYDIDAARGEQTKEEFVTSLKPDSPMYSDPESRVTPWEKDALIADLPAPIENADGKFVHLIYFDFDKSNISDEDRAYIEKVSKILSADPNKKIILSGHTDSQGSAAYNLRLSDRRAKTVKDYFTKMGINPAQIITEGLGESQLFIKDTDANGGYILKYTKLNRRCEVEIK